MKPLILEFREIPTIDNATDNLEIEYSRMLNLNIDKLTGKPAIECIEMGTETFTKSFGEGSDSDKGGLSIMMETETRTFTRSEDSDSDANSFNGQVLMSTMTATRSEMEGTDSDR